MSVRVLVAVPLAWALAYLAGDILIGPGAALEVFRRADIELVKGLAVIGSLAAALTLKPGEYLRRAWMFTGLSMLTLLLRDVYLSLATPTALTTWLDGGLVVLGNLFGVIGAFMLARAWKLAGLELPGSRASRLMLISALVVPALVFAGPAVAISFRNLLAGDLTAVVDLGSGLGDTVSLCLIAPLLLTALALRGGLLSWPWFFFTACLMSWLVYDAVVVVAPYLGASSATVDTVSETLRTLACLFQFSAGMAQRQVSRMARRRLPT